MIVKINSGDKKFLDFGKSAHFSLENGELTTSIANTYNNHVLTADFPAGLRYVAVTHKYPKTHNMFVDGVKYAEDVSE